ncbi:MAG: SLC13 family permease [Flavobacteriales bacterium]|nr:SLC13 family permease [Flavobacteriales bacterium]
MHFEAYIVVGVILFLVVFLYKEYLRPSFSFVIGVSILLLTGVINAKEALHGFANEQLAVIVLLLMLSGTLGQTRLIDKAFGAFFKEKDSPRIFFAKMLGGVGVASAFLNNTPLVAMMMPYVNKWSKDNDQVLSKYLIPLSFASILGGCVTLIGTSTNLIANGLAIEYGEEGLGIFDFTYAGLPMLFIGIVFLLVFGKRLLPENTTEDITESLGREYCIETIVKAGSPLIGKTVEEAGLRNLEDLFLFEIIKRNRIVRPAPPDVVLRQGDKLLFVGDTDSIAELTSPKLGLSLPEPSTLPPEDIESVVELVVSPNSNLVNRSVKDSDFRSLFNGAIMAINRDGERISGKIGEVIIRPGDLLMVLAGRDFFNRINQSKDFYFLSYVKEINRENRRGALVLFFGLLLSIGLAVTSLVPLLTSLACLVVLSIILGMQKLTEIKNNVDFDLILIIAMGLALGKAMINSGVAEALADRVVFIHEGFGVYGLLVGLFLMTNVLTAFMTSKAAVAIILPVALSIAHSIGIPIPAVILIVAYGGAASFMTPIGYQTNLMVYGPGGYRFRDFFKIGLPLTLVYCFVAVVVLAYVYGL